MSQALLEALAAITGPAHVLTGPDAGPYAQDWSGLVRWQPRAVVRPADTAQTAAIMRLANETATPVVPVSGNTGLTGGTAAEGAIMLSLSRLSAIRAINPAARTAEVGAGVILSRLHDAAAEHDLAFPLTFGARGSAMIGGCLATNAEGSNVLRYGNARALCLGIEAVTPTGEVLNCLGALYKDNTGYDLRDLLIGSEGTLGIVTAATLRLFPRPRAHATAMVAMADVDAALGLLNTLQAESGGGVEAFEYMSGDYMDAWQQCYPGARPPFAERHEVNILVEIGAMAARDADPGPDGRVPVAVDLEGTLARGLGAGIVRDAVIARSGAERAGMWARREAVAEVSRLHNPRIDCDIAVPLDTMAALIERTTKRARALDPGVAFMNIGHLGDGNLHFSAWPETADTSVHRAICEAVEEEALALGGSFSAEHGIGLTKLPAMARHKDPVALSTMRAIKRALDPNNILNPGKVLP